jgi:death on curing protein
VREPAWIREVEALAFHDQQLRLFGGSPGLRDRGLLESALARPKNLFVYADSPVRLTRLAAAYAIGISKNHPFVDGNKRTAMQVAFVFLEYNGRLVQASQEDAYLTFLRVGAGEITEDQLAAWFERNTAPR